VIRGFADVWRGKFTEQWGRPVIGITGSAGRRRRKELTAHVLSANGIDSRVSAIIQRLGLPLSVLQMVSLGIGQRLRSGVLKWMSSPTHEIRRLVKITPPDVGVELMVAPVHLEHLADQTVAAMKAELIEGLKPGALAVPQRG